MVYNLPCNYIRLLGIIKDSKLNNQAFKEFINKLASKTYQKNEIIIPANSIHKNVYYVEKGFIRAFYYDTKGNDITHWFTAEQEVLTVLSSVINKTVSIYGVQALENNTTVRISSYEQFWSLKNQSDAIRLIFENTLINATIKVTNKLIAIQTKSAKERYFDLLHEHPEIFKRANLGYIATYLGMKQQSLSRIRAEK